MVSLHSIKGCKGKMKKLTDSRGVFTQKGDFRIYHCQVIEGLERCSSSRNNETHKTEQAHSDHTSKSIS